jgi:ubiquinone/menaquinone biosynthesis C-methylase UbiE
VQPKADVFGVDVDPGVLAIARRKVREAGVDIGLELATATQLPYRDGSFHHIFVILVLHHLNRHNKRRVLNEIVRVLRLGGALHMIDFGSPANLPAYPISFVTRWFEEIDDHINGLLPAFIRDAGFRSVVETARYATVSGTFCSYPACKLDGVR